MLFSNLRPIVGLPPFLIMIIKEESLLILNKNVPENNLLLISAPIKISRNYKYHDFSK